MKKIEHVMNIRLMDYNTRIGKNTIKGDKMCSKYCQKLQKLAKKLDICIITHKEAKRPNNK